MFCRREVVIIDFEYWNGLQMLQVDQDQGAQAQAGRGLDWNRGQQPGHLLGTEASGPGVGLPPRGPDALGGVVTWTWRAALAPLTAGRAGGAWHSWLKGDEGGVWPLQRRHSSRSHC